MIWPNYVPWGKVIKEITFEDRGHQVVIPEGSSVRRWNDKAILSEMQVSPPTGWIPLFDADNFGEGGQFADRFEVTRGS